MRDNLEHHQIYEEIVVVHEDYAIHRIFVDGYVKVSIR